MLDHDQAVEYLNISGPVITLKLKYFPTAKPFLSPTQQQSMFRIHFNPCICARLVYIFYCFDLALLDLKTLSDS